MLIEFNTSQKHSVEVSVETNVTSTLTYNFWNKAATDIKICIGRTLWVSWMFLGSIKFYEHVEALLKFKI